jgi:tRNA nucleotidyltransferase (CCA-adding enzyme)
MDVITTHMESDFDGLASMVAAKKLYPDANLIIPGGSQPGVRSFLERHPLPLTPANQIDPRQITRLILVDTQDSQRIGLLEKAFQNPEMSVHIFDHHPSESKGTLLPAADFRVIETVGATTTLLVEILQKREIPITPLEATLYAIGVYEETGSLVYPNTTPRDLQVAAHLVKSGADLRIVADFITRHLTIPQIQLLNALLQAAHPLHLGRRRVVLAVLSWPTYVQDMAPVIQQVAQLEGADAILAAVAMEGKVQFIGRSRREDIDMHRIAQALGGGGHLMAAAASIKGLTLAEVEDRLRALLEEQAKTWLPIRDLMTTPVRTISTGTTLRDTERFMTQYEVNSLPVIDPKGRFLGLATREAIQKALYHQLYSVPVDQVMLQEVFTANPHTPFDVIQEHMVERNQRSVPILKNRKVVGIFSRTDLLRASHQHQRIQKSIESTSTGHLPTLLPPGRNLKGLMADRLPRGIRHLLTKVGQVADQLGISAYVVGGFVRDLFLGNQNLDVDIVVEGDGIRFSKALGQHLSAKVKVHERFGTASLKLSKDSEFAPDMAFDVATARTEYYEFPTALPTVERSSVKKDLYRRDFTINALAIRLNKNSGELLDFFGGQRDLKDKVIRVLHSLSFVEDPTRAFRAVRFEQRFGFAMSKETRTFIRNAVDMELFHRLSGHRLGDELIHLFSESQPANAIRRLRECDLLKFVHPKIPWTPKSHDLFQSIQEIVTWHRLEIAHEPLQRWLLYAMALFEPVGRDETVKTWKKLGFPGRHIRMVDIFLTEQQQLLRVLFRKQLSPSETHALLQTWALEPLLFLMAKIQRQDSKKHSLQRIKEFITTFRHINTSITGHDLQTLGLQKGPAYRQVLHQLLTARLDGTIQTRQEELSLAKSLVAKAQPSPRKIPKR